MDRLSGQPSTSQPQPGVDVLMTAPYRTIGAMVGSGGAAGGGATPLVSPRWLFLHTDHLGSPRVIVDASGNVVSTHHYMPFGDEKPLPTRLSSNNRRFTGHERDPESASTDNPDGLDYMLARYYSSSIDRFMLPDPGNDTDIGDPQSWNEYSYVRNDPLDGIDPFGEDTYRVNRGLGQDTNPPVSYLNPFSHSMDATTGPPTAEHPNGVVEHTSSWHGTDKDPQTTLDNPHDIDVAQEAIDEGKAKWRGGEDLDPLTEDEMRKARDYAPGYKKHGWVFWRDCKAEARRVIRNAKKRLKATQRESAQQTIPYSPSQQAVRDWYLQRNVGGSYKVDGFFNLYVIGGRMCTCMGTICNC